MSSKEKLIIFVKNEEAGTVKTRLAASVGDKKALNIYQELLDYTCGITRNLLVHKEVWYSRFIPENDRWEKEHFSKKIQSGEGLGTRMLNAFKYSFENEDYEKVVIIGSDCAELTSDIIQKAYKKLDTHEFVIGPAEDGGYYLLGMRAFHPQVFEEIEWSTESVFNETLKIFKELGASFAKLEELNDVDTIEDWNEVKSKV